MTDRPPLGHRHAAGRSRIRERVLAGEEVLGAFLNLGAPLAAELCARAGFDWLLVDLEHGAGTEADLLAQLYAIEGAAAPSGARCAAIVRPEEGTRLRIGRSLDLGAEGIMLPRLERPDEIQRVVSWLRYPPTGVRGVALLTRGAELGEVAHGDVARLNDRVLGIVQVESPLAVANAGALAAIDGVDVLFVGPTDLSHSLGVPGFLDAPEYLAALGAVVKACRSHGKAAGILLRSADALDRHRELGFTFIGLSSDGAYVTDGARAALARAAERGPRG
ncbi:MAG TPA: aldolase/citrate lyase family protein [Candidatus Dormibacteraeota bacterium]|nr:aldolase/citrate lyase family protein [Candidatus Dormibacteraeota bacterium]